MDIPETRVSLPGMKVSATISGDGSSVSAIIPKGIAACRFLLIDANGCMQYSEVVVAK